MADWEIPGTGFKLTNVHTETARCRVGSCVIHNPSNSIMNVESWPYNWNLELGGLMERICYHGCAHPDADVVSWHKGNGDDWVLEHDCDGCCTRQVEEK